MFLIFLFFISIYNLFSDGFIQKKGDFLLINTLYLSNLQETETKIGNILNSRIGSFMFINYFEYGVFSRITIGGKITTKEYFQDKNSNVFGQVARKSGALEGLEVLTRILIFNHESFVLSHFSSIKMPGFFFDKEELYQQFGAVRYPEYQTGFELGFSLEDKDNIQVYTAKNIFFTFGVYYRTNIKFWDEMRFSFTLGLPFTEKVILLIKFLKINYFFKNTAFSPQDMLLFNGSMFAIAEIYTSGLFKITDYLMLEFGYKVSIHSDVIKTALRKINDNTIFVGFWNYF